MSGRAGGESLLHPGARAAVLRRLGRLTIDDLHGLDAAVRELGADKPYRGRVNRGYWLAWYDGPRLSNREGGELGELFPAVVVAIAGGITGLDVERFGARFRSGQQAGLFGGLARFVRPDSTVRALQDAAIGLIEDAVAPWDPRLAIVACWNLACAATLRAHLPAQTLDVLEAAWRRAVGEPPA